MKLKKIDWLNHSLEFFVVIIGILIAFQLNKCSENNSKSQLIEQHLNAIDEETDFNLYQIKNSINISTSTLQKMDTLLNLLKSPDENRYKINLLAVQLMNVDYCYIKKNAYNNLISTGDVRFLKDYESKNKIISLYEYYSWLETTNSANIETFSTYYFPFMLEKTDLLNPMTTKDSVYREGYYKNILSSFKYTNEYSLSRLKATKGHIENFIFYRDSIKEL